MSLSTREEDALKTIAAQAAAMVAYHPARTKHRRNRMESGDTVVWKWRDASGRARRERFIGG